MARPSQSEYQEILLAALPVDGSEIEYADLAETLRSQGHGEAMNYFRHVKKIGLISASVSFDETGSNMRHVVKKVVS